jgi:hypothetical protein
MENFDASMLNEVITELGAVIDRAIHASTTATLDRLDHLVDFNERIAIALERMANIIDDEE